MNGMVAMARSIAVAGIVTIGILIPGAAGSALAGDYWACEGGNWVAVGRPDYPMPLKICGAKVEIPKTAEDCALRGGTWKRLGLSPAPSCLMPAALDGGRVCGDSDECEGMCLSDYDIDDAMLMQGRDTPARGHCSETIQVFGCNAIVAKGRVRGVLCID